MTMFFKGLWRVLCATSPWWGCFLVAFLLGLVLTPVCRELARRLGMVDKPSARRINKTPIPRAGGLAVFLATTLTVLAYACVTGRQLSPLMPNETFYQLICLAGCLVVMGLFDDKFGLPPLVKLAGQVGVALGAFFWCGIGFHTIPVLSGIPVAADCCLTVFWIVGAINAFNLIDGLDGLATGLALIAAIGMGGALFFVGYPQATLVYFIFAGACLAFLRYNFNPASVFLGDTGSMFLGFTLSTLPLTLKSGDSLFVSLGVPLLAMGVPIFDTALAIVRRTLRAVLSRGQRNVGEVGNAHVMQADTDHLHHRILRKFVSQRKAAGALYGLAAFLVAVGFGGLALRDRAAGLFILAFIVAVVIVIRDMRRIELWDAGRLLNAAAHDHTSTARRRSRMLVTPYFVVTDVLALVLVYAFTTLAMGLKFNGYTLHTAFPLRIVPVFFCLIFFRAYSTVWGRAMISNYARLFVAVFVGTLAGSAAIILFRYPHTHLMAFSGLFFALSFLALGSLRLMRPVLRDLFYSLDAGRLADDPATSRIVVYGAGLRYNMFRKELVRASAHNHRVIVGLLDDNVLLRGLYIGGIRVHGTLNQAEEVLRRLRADAVVIACVLSPERRALAKKIFAKAGVKVTMWRCEEQPLV